MRLCLILQPFLRFTYVTAQFLNHSFASPTSPLIFQPFLRFTYVTVNFSTLPLLHLRHRSFSTLPSLHLRHRSVFKLFLRFTYVTAHFFIPLTSLHLRHRSFFNPSIASPTLQLNYNLSVASLTSQALHLRHLASRPCKIK